MNVIPLKINYKYNKKNVFSSYLGWGEPVEITGNFDFLCSFVSQVFYSNHISPLNLILLTNII